jgi:pimeloyl-ACP methyl ester carboxylesterase
VRYDDWGARSQQWAGLHSVSTSLCGVPVHHIRAEPDPAAAPDAPVHLLIPPMTGSASMWIDLVPHLRRFGPVMSVDLPWTITGHTGTPYRRGPRADLDARFVSAFVRERDFESQVVLHGWSTGGLVAAWTAGMMPEKTRGVVLVAPALPWRRTSPAETLLWQTLGRLAVAVGPATTRIAVRLAGRRLLDAKRSAIGDAGAVSASDGRTGLVGGDPSRVSSAQADLWLDDLEAAREHSERLAGAATAFASVIKAMFITQRPTNEALDCVPVPVLVLWGGDDPLVDPTSLMQHARRPRWTPRPIDNVGHLLPIEAPDLYAQAVGQWLADIGL